MDADPVAVGESRAVEVHEKKKKQHPNHSPNRLLWKQRGTEALEALEVVEVALQQGTPVSVAAERNPVEAARNSPSVDRSSKKVVEGNSAEVDNSRQDLPSAVSSVLLLHIHETRVLAEPGRTSSAAAAAGVASVVVVGNRREVVDERMAVALEDRLEEDDEADDVVVVHAKGVEALADRNREVAADDRIHFHLEDTRTTALHEAAVVPRSTLSDGREYSRPTETSVLLLHAAVDPSHHDSHLLLLRPSSPSIVEPAQPNSLDHGASLDTR